MRLQLHNEFHQVKIKDLNDENNVEMVTSAARGGKAFVAEQKNPGNENQNIEMKCPKIEIYTFKNNIKICPEQYEK